MLKVFVVWFVQVFFLNLYFEAFPTLYGITAADDHHNPEGDTDECRGLGKIFHCPSVNLVMQSFYKKVSDKHIFNKIHVTRKCTSRKHKFSVRKCSLE